MITTNGKTHIKRYLAGQVPSIAQSIAFGIGGGAESLTETRLNFEVERAPLQLVAYDFINDNIIYKTSVPTQFEGAIYEIGLVSGAQAPNSKIITTFDSTLEFWTGQASYATTNTRMGLDSLLLNSTGLTSISSNLALDLSTITGKDEFKFAFFNTSSVNPTIRFKTDASNYYYFNLTGAGNGYQILSRTKDQAQVQGSPNWATITSIEVKIDSGTLQMDGIRIEDNTYTTDNGVLVARKSLTTPFVKQNNSVQDVEFALKVTL